MLYVLPVLLLGWVLLHILLRPKPALRPLLISHRGAGGLAPENTLAAVREGIRHGADYIEVDVQRTADGILAVIHDEMVDRTTMGTGAVRDMDWKTLRALDAGSRHAPRFAGERIPLLHEVLTLLRDSTAGLYLEAKSPALYPGIEHEIATALETDAGGPPVLVASFDHAWAARFQRMHPGVAVALLSEIGLDIPPSSPFVWASVSWRSILLFPGLAHRLRRGGRRLLVWTVDAEWLMRLVLWLGAEGIVTNRPDRGRRALRREG